jgi:hypothetical protein
MNNTINETIKSIISNTTPTHLSVTPAPTPYPAGILTTPLDWAPIPLPPFNIPLWVIFGLLSLGALIIVVFHWKDMNANLDAIKPWFIKAKELKLGKKQVIRLSRAGDFIPDSLNIFDNVLSYGDSEDNINMWHLNSPQGIIRIGGISAAVLSEDNDQNRDIVSEIAVVRAAKYLENNLDEIRSELNDRYKDLVDRGEYSADAPNPAELIRPIKNGNDYIGKYDENLPADYSRSGRFLLQLLNPSGIRIDSYNQFNQNESRKFWFRGKTSAFFGGENIRKVEDKFVKKSDTQPGFLQKYGALLICAMLGIGLSLLAVAVPL